MRSSQAGLLDIGEVARASGHTPATLRFYEEKGLIRPHGRRGLRRLYAEQVLERLALIDLGRAVGFTLDELAAMMPLGRRVKIDRAQLLSKAAELEALMKRLSIARRALLHAVECQEPDYLSCPHFRRVIRAAMRRPVPASPLAVSPASSERRRKSAKRSEASRPRRRS